MSGSAKPDDLKYDPSTHFRFGENWEAYSRLITDPKIDQALDDMKRLLGATDLSGSSFVDVGCGSGLHSLVALRLGAAPVAGFDFDAQSVETARALLETRAKGNAWRIEQKNVFDVDPDTDGTFDWVYSWGVLHHTGALWDAIEKAMTLVADKGRFVRSQSTGRPPVAARGPALSGFTPVCPNQFKGSSADSTLRRFVWRWQHLGAIHSVISGLTKTIGGWIISLTFTTGLVAIPTSPRPRLRSSLFLKPGVS